MVSLNINALKILSLSALALILLFNTCTPALAQQNVIANKDVTRPEIQQNLAKPAFINMFKADKKNGYNEISWSSRNDQDVQRFIVEFSTDGVNFQSAGEVSLNGGVNYTHQHYFRDDRPMLYRINMQMTNMRNAYSESIFLDGIDVPPVRFYPTIVTGNILNINADWPVQRMTIVSTAGTQVFAKDLNGQLHHIPVGIPSLGRGMYIVTFYGNGWQSAGKMIVS